MPEINTNKNRTQHFLWFQIKSSDFSHHKINFNHKPKFKKKYPVYFWRYINDMKKNGPNTMWTESNKWQYHVKVNWCCEQTWNLVPNCIWAHVSNGNNIISSWRYLISQCNVVKTHLTKDFHWYRFQWKNTRWGHTVFVFFLTTRLSGLKFE